MAQSTIISTHAEYTSVFTLHMKQILTYRKSIYFDFYSTRKRLSIFVLYRHLYELGVL